MQGMNPKRKHPEGEESGREEEENTIEIFEENWQNRGKFKKVEMPIFSGEHS